MTAATAVAPGTPVIGATVRRRAVWALARVEAVRLLRHPLTLAALAFLVGIWVSGWFTNQANQFPVLQDVDRDSELGMMLLLGGAALVAGNLAALRAHRDGTAALGQVLILPAAARALAHLLALLPLAGLGAALVLARIAVLAVFTPAAGHPNPYELATGPATVLLFGALGVLLARLTRSAVAAPLMLLAVLALLVVLPLLTQGGSARWLQPVVAQGDPDFALPVPAYLMTRPAAAHLGYLLGIAGGFAVAAVALAGSRGTRVLLAGVVAVACAVAGGVIQVAPPSHAADAARRAAAGQPAEHETCRVLHGVTYCAFPDFTAWVPAWDAVVQAVLARVPAPDRPANLVVRQRIVMDAGNAFGQWQADDAAAGTPGAITVDTRWGDSRSAAALAARVAYRILAGPRLPGTPCAATQVTGGDGVLLVWLAGQAGAPARTGLDKLVSDQNAGRDGLQLPQAAVLPGILVPAPELAVALAALDRPDADLTARVQASWAALRGAGAQDAARLLGLPVPPGSAARPIDYCR